MIPAVIATGLLLGVFVVLLLLSKKGRHLLLEGLLHPIAHFAEHFLHHHPRTTEGTLIVLSWVLLLAVIGGLWYGVWLLVSHLLA